MKLCDLSKMTAFGSGESFVVASLFRRKPFALIGIWRNITPFRGGSVVEKWTDVACCPASRGRVPSQERIEQMESLLKGRLRNSHLAFTKAMIPLLEAVVNSIESIEDDSAGDGRPIRAHRVEIQQHDRQHDDGDNVDRKDPRPQRTKAQPAPPFLNLRRFESEDARLR